MAAWNYALVSLLIKVDINFKNESHSITIFKEWGILNIWI